MKKQAFLLVTNQLTKKIVEQYYLLKSATADLGEVYILYHASNGTEDKLKSYSEQLNIEVFTDDILRNIGYTPIKNALVPGSNHFPVLQFYLDHSQYSYYWSIEDDVVFNGDWKKFFNNVSTHEFDFITSHIRRYSDVPDWSWWNSFKQPQEDLDKPELVNSFNPIYRISDKALSYIHNCLITGYSGHHEVLIVTLLNRSGFKIADFSDTENELTPTLSYCTLKTMRWVPVFLFIGFNKNKLYHPVKGNLTNKQIEEYAVRTLMNKKKYHTYSKRTFRSLFRSFYKRFKKFVIKRTRIFKLRKIEK
jgi:hypothetical protein